MFTSSDSDSKREYNRFEFVKLVSGLLFVSIDQNSKCSYSLCTIHYNRRHVLIKQSPCMYTREYYTCSTHIAIIVIFFKYFFIVKECGTRPRPTRSYPNLLRIHCCHRRRHRSRALQSVFAGSRRRRPGKAVSRFLNNNNRAGKSSYIKKIIKK